jgi:hypothetical protein
MFTRQLRREFPDEKVELLAVSAFSMRFGNKQVRLPLVSYEKALWTKLSSITETFGAVVTNEEDSLCDDQI